MSTAYTTAPVAKVVFCNCLPNGSQYDLAADGYCRNVAIGQLSARLIRVSDNATIFSVTPISNGGSPTHWKVDVSGLGLSPGTRYVLEISNASTPLDHAPVIP